MLRKLIFLYLLNNEIYNDDKMEYLKKIVFNNKKIKFDIFSFIQIYGLLL